MPIKALIEEQPSFDYRTVAALPGMNKNTVQRVFQLMRWQVHKRPTGCRPRVQSLPSAAAAPNERWATDLCRVWSGRDGWAMLALVIDCHTRASCWAGTCLGVPRAVLAGQRNAKQKR